MAVSNPILHVFSTSMWMTDTTCHSFLPYRVFFFLKVSLQVHEVSTSEEEKNIVKFKERYLLFGPFSSHCFLKCTVGVEGRDTNQVPFFFVEGI